MLQDRTKECTDEQSSMSSSAETPSVDDSSGQSRAQTSFQYAPLEPSDCSIRLIVLECPESSYSDEPEIRCRILHTTFGAKPKYEALSYTWGTEISKQPIKLDGHPFHVTNNLFDALLHLRSSELKRTLWIDAICINQKDIDERNSQIQFMPFIYKRAETVVVWLGRHLSHYFQISESQYWQRLWVIQEVAKARRLKVCWAANQGYRHDFDSYALQSYDWKDFIQNFAKGHDHVYRFDKLRRGRYGDSSLLWNLLQDHQGAQCTDPRDKIYGLVGLSIDCSGRLPIDYRKSLWEVYKDVILVYNGFPEILELSRLLKRLIGGPDQTLRQDLEGDEDSKMFSLRLDPEDVTTVKILSCFLGTIVHIGPTYNDVISFPQKARQWDAAVEEKVNNEKSKSREQSDIFLEALEATDEAALKTRLSLERKTSWRPLQDEDGKRASKALDSETRPEPSENCLAVSLFLVHDEQGRSPRTAMGICCEGAAVGDFVFQIPKFGLAMIVRRLQGAWELVGYAGIAMTAEQGKQQEQQQEQQQWSELQRSKLQRSELQFDVLGAEGAVAQFFGSRSGENDFILYMDMPTLYRISD